MNKDSLLKLFSLCIAIALYVYVTNENNARTVEIVVPVEVVDIPDGLTLLSPRVPQTRVTIKGPSALVSRLVTNPPVYRVVVPQPVQNAFTKKILPRELSLPPYVQVQRVVPREIEFLLGKESPRDREEELSR